jgi:hypothetical protein
MINKFTVIEGFFISAARILWNFAPFDEIESGNKFLTTNGADLYGAEF